MKHTFILLNSFDRSGSTLISKTLAEHPQVENLFNPFNATVFRRTFMEVWSPDSVSEQTDEGNGMIETVLMGDFTEQTIRSRVFFPNSSTHRLVDGALHIIKTTNFHGKIAWFRKNYPDIDIIGLTRAPIAILASLVRNGFHRDWYGGWAYESLSNSIQDYGLDGPTEQAFFEAQDEVEEMAWIIACLNRKMIQDLGLGETLRYEDVIDRPDEVLNNLLRPYGLEEFAFAPFFKDTVNSSGKRFQGKDVYKEVFSREEIIRYQSIFERMGLIP